jgi:pyruvate,water dikinase
VEAMTEAFFQGDYDFLNQHGGNRLPGFYTPTGDWQLIDEDEEGKIILQDGSRWVSSLGSGFAVFMGKLVGPRYQEFLDNVNAYYYFPLVIARESSVEDAEISVQVKAMGGRIDQAGGLVFGLRNVGNYFVLRINALEDNLVLFEFVNNRRFSRISVPVEVLPERWYTIRVETAGQQIQGYLDDELLMEHTGDWPVQGHVGLWTKADSVTRFRNLEVKPKEGH